MPSNYAEQLCRAIMPGKYTISFFAMAFCHGCKYFAWRREERRFILKCN